MKVNIYVGCDPATQKDYSGEWAVFWDMSSGGGEKLDWELIFIQAPEKQAVSYFEDKFDRNPYNITCSCCGEDYSVSSGPIAEVAKYHFKGWGEKIDDAEFMSRLQRPRSNMKFIFADEI